jgi:site-specific recombinase XerD
MQKEIEKFIAYLKVERHYALNTQQAYEKDLRQLSIESISNETNSDTLSPQE